MSAQLGSLLAFFSFTSLVGLIVIRMGYLIKDKNKPGLIAGYDPNRVKDQQGLCDFIGTNTLLVGSLVILFGAAISITLFFNPNSLAILGWIAAEVACVVGLAIRAVTGARKFQH